VVAVVVHLMVLLLAMVAPALSLSITSQRLQLF
jgi:hypothetical protein